MKRFFILLILVVACVEPTTSEAPTNAWRVGALLPFTGVNSYGAESAEQAMMLAAEQVNALGGVAGRPLWITARNTQSDTTLGLAEARELIDEGVLALLGPEDSNLVKILRGILKQKKVLQISGEVTAAPATTVDDGGLVFQVVPSILTFAASLAELVRASQAAHVVIFYVDDDYGKRFKDGMLCALGDRVPDAVLSFGEDEAALTAAVAALPSTVDAYVLIGYPRGTAALIQRLKSRSAAAPLWFLAPSLRNPRLLANISMGALEGAQGIAPALQEDDAVAFEAMFTARWRNASTYAAPFYYDAMVLLALATAAAGQIDQNPTAEQVSTQMQRVASPPGVAVTWRELGRALELVRSGEDIDYTGVTGNVDLDAEGETPSGLIDVFTVVGGTFATQATRPSMALETCF